MSTDKCPDADLDPSFNLSKDILEDNTSVADKKFNKFQTLIPFGNHICFTNSKHKHNKFTENSWKMVISVWQYSYISLQFIRDFLIVEGNMPSFSLVPSKFLRR